MANIASEVDVPTVAVAVPAMLPNCIAVKLAAGITLGHISNKRSSAFVHAAQLTDLHRSRLAYEQLLGQ